MKIKSQKGSIALFVLIALLFYTGFLLLLYANNLNKIQTITEKTDILKGIYERNIDNINDVYNTEIAKKDNVKPIIKDIPTTINVGETEIEDPYVEYGASGGTTEYKVFSRTFTTIGDIVNYVEENNSYGKQTISITAIGNNDLVIQQDIEIEFIYVPYIKLEYIESTGTQYIDTGITANNNPSIKANFSMTNNSVSTQAVLGCRGAMSGATSYAIFFNVVTNQLRLDWLGSNGNYFKIDLNKDINIELNANGSIIVNGTEYENVVEKTGCNFNILIGNFTDSNGNPRAIGTYAKWKKVEIRENDNLARDFIPVTRKSDNVVCMYDKVSGEFFENSGAGEFVAGPVVGNASE